MRVAAFLKALERESCEVDIFRLGPQGSDAVAKAIANPAAVEQSGTPTHVPCPTDSTVVDFGLYRSPSIVTLAVPSLMSLIFTQLFWPKMPRKFFLSQERCPG